MGKQVTSQYSLVFGAALLLGSMSCGTPAEPHHRTPQAETTFNCEPIILRLKARRGLSQHEQLIGIAASMRAHSPHLDVPENDLVKFYVAQWQHGRPYEWWLAQDLELVGRYMLCDDYLREVVSQRYVSIHQELRL